MEKGNIRLKLHQYIDMGDDKLLKMMYAIAKEYNADEYTFSDEEIAVFDDRTNKWLSGENKAYNWEEAKAIITGKKKLDAI